MLRNPVRVVCLAAAAVGLSTPSPAAPPGKGFTGNVPGKRWEYVATQNKKTIEEGTFRAHEYKIWRGGTQVGSFKWVAKDHVVIEMEKGKLKGTIDLRLVRLKPFREFDGTWDMADGGKAHIHIKFLED
jgi:hypothetical protein